MNSLHTSASPEDSSSVYSRSTFSVYPLATIWKSDSGVPEKLLIRSSRSIVDIAFACGFVSAPHFSKCYRDFFGLPPREERIPRGVATQSKAPIDILDATNIDPAPGLAEDLPQDPNRLLN
ncbi:helix-turn-helix domain-containing protein [Arenicellales bacterium nBUS_45]